MRPVASVGPSSRRPGARCVDARRRAGPPTSGGGGRRGRRRRWPARARRAAGGPSRDTGACADEPAVARQADQDDQQGLGHRRRRAPPASTVRMDRARAAGRLRPAASHRRARERAAHQPIVPILIGELPQRAQQGEQQEALLAIDPQASAGLGRQRRGTAPVGEWDRQPTQGEQVQTADEREGITVQSHVTAPLRAGLCRGGTGA